MNKVHQAVQRICSKPNPSLVNLLAVGNAMKVSLHGQDEDLVDRQSFVDGIIGAALEMPLVAELSRNRLQGADECENTSLPQ